MPRTIEIPGTIDEIEPRLTYFSSLVGDETGLPAGSGNLFIPTEDKLPADGIIRAGAPVEIMGKVYQAGEPIKK